MVKGNMGKRLSWGEAAERLDEYTLTQALIVYSESEGECVTGAFTVNVYEHPSGSTLYVRARPDNPVAGCLIGPELEPLLPADAEMDEPFSDAYVKALAEGEKRLGRRSINLDIPSELQGKEN